MHGNDGSWTARETNIEANELYTGETVGLRRPLLGPDEHPTGLTFVAARLGHVEPAAGDLDR